MRFKKIVTALVACMAVAAVSANAAQAGWTIEGVGELGATAQETVEVNKHPGSALVLHSSLLGAEITLTAENVHCAEVKAGECTIDGSSYGTNHSTGRLEFTGVTVDLEGKPSECSVSGGGAATGNVRTEPLTDEVIMDPSNEAGPVFDKFFPENKETNTFVTIKLEGENCAADGAEAAVKGAVSGEAVTTNGSEEFVSLATGELTSPQTLLFSKAAQETAGTKLTLGKAEAQLTGAVDNVLSGKNKEKAFGADE